MKADTSEVLFGLIYLPDLTQAEAIAEAKKRKGRILVNTEISGLLQQKLLNLDLFPVWVGTHLEYEGENAILKENGKNYGNMKIPKEDGWFKPNIFGIPDPKKPSNEDDPEATYFFRIEKNSGLLARGSVRLYDGGRRVVYADFRLYDRLGVFITTRK